MNQTCPFTVTAEQTYRVPRISLLLFVLGALCLDLSLPRASNLKTGNLAMLVLMAIAIVFMAYSNSWRVRVPRLRHSNTILFIYLLFAGISALWSPSWVDAGYQILLLLTIFVTAILLAPTPPHLLVRYIVMLAGATALLSLAVIPIDSNFAFQPHTAGDRLELRGVFEHQLRLGLFMGMALFLLLLTWLNGDISRTFPRKWWVLLAVPTIITAFILAYARLYSLYVLLAFCLTVAFSQGRIIKWLASAAVLALVIVALIYQSNLESTLAGAGFDTSLTGRTTIWARTIGEARLSPFIGHGFASFDNPTFDYLWPGVYRPPHPHNSYIQAFFETGCIGLALIVLVSLSHLIVGAKETQAERYSYSFFIAVILVLGSLTGANYSSKPVALYCLALVFLSSKAYLLENKH